MLNSSYADINRITVNGTPVEKPKRNSAIISTTGPRNKPVEIHRAEGHDTERKSFAISVAPDSSGTIHLLERMLISLGIVIEAFDHNTRQKSNLLVISNTPILMVIVSFMENQSTWK